MGRTRRILMAYDADCGPCTRFRHFVERIDSRGELDFISLIDADDSGLLDQIPEAERHTSFHLILPDGPPLTGANAVPRLLELLPGGATLAKLVSSSSAGRAVISVVYAGFARGHNGSACAYPRPVAAPRTAFSKPRSPGPAPPRLSRSAYVLTGMVGGLFGALLMGLAVRLPDALCVHLATTLAGPSSGTLPLAWGFHFLTAVTIGSVFGALASITWIGDGRHWSRNVTWGVFAGAIAWAVFFMPLMLAFLPGLVTPLLVESSFVAHVLLGTALGVTLAGSLSWRGRRPDAGEGRAALGPSPAGPQEEEGIRSR